MSVISYKNQSFATLMQFNSVMTFLRYVIHTVFIEITLLAFLRKETVILFWTIQCSNAFRYAIKLHILFFHIILIQFDEKANKKPTRLIYSRHLATSKVQLLYIRVSSHRRQNIFLCCNMCTACISDGSLVFPEKKLTTRI